MEGLILDLLEESPTLKAIRISIPWLGQKLADTEAKVTALREEVAKLKGEW
jgi:hypothetical protein